MAIVPAGSPAWVRTSDHTTYGGDLNKVNWHSQGVTNAQTDVGAESFCRLAEDLAAVARTGAFCELTVQCNDGAGGSPPTILVINQMTGVRVVSYAGKAPPAGFPSGSRHRNGDVTLLWAPAHPGDYRARRRLEIMHRLISA